MKKNVIIALLASSALSAAPAFAQTATPPVDVPLAQAAPQSEEAPIGDIVVTARRVSESLQRTPVAVTAVSGDALVARGVSDVSAIQQIAPNVTFNPTASNSGSSNAAVVFIRGIGQSDFYPQVDPGVGIYLDGVYVSRTTGAVLDAVDVGQIEVLRGPQGTLYGKNTIGGAINITSRRPANELGGYVEATLGRFGRIDGKVRIDAPLSESIRTAISFATLNRDGYYSQRDFATGREVGRLGDVNALTARFALDADVADGFTLQFTADWTRRREASAGSTLLEVNATGLAPAINNTVTTAPTFGIPFDARYISRGNPYVNYGDPRRSRSDLDVWGAALTANWEISDALTVKSITAYRTSESTSDRDGDGSPALILQPFTLIDQKQFSQELQLLGSLWDNRVSYIAGLYFLDERVFFDGPVNIAFVDTDNTANIRNRAYAAFGQLGVNVADGLRLTLGARYTIDKKRNDARIFATRLIDPATFTSVPPFALPIQLLVDDARRTDEKFTPSVTVDYQFTANVFGYATYSKGFKSGGFSQRIAFPRTAAPAFDPETVTNYEAGLKLQTSDRRFRLNMAAFYLDYSNLQVVIFNRIEPQTQNGGQATIKGAEAEFQATPVKGLNLSMAVGYLNARYDAINPGTLIPAGANLAYTPDWTLSGSINYDAELGEGWHLRPQADFAYRSAVNFDALNTPSLRQPGYAIVNANISLTDPSSTWRLSVGVSNLTDKRYIVGGFSDLPASGFTDATFARPREWSVSMRYTF
jgi:iron complex outermembrane recepter protein